MGVLSFSNGRFGGAKRLFLFADFIEASIACPMYVFRVWYCTVLSPAKTVDV